MGRPDGHAERQRLRVLRAHPHGRRQVGSPRFRPEPLLYVLAHPCRGTVPADFSYTPVAQSIGANTIVFEYIAQFNHSVNFWLVPYPPTNRIVSVLMVLSIGYDDNNKMTYERLYPEGSSILVQIGVLHDGYGIYKNDITHTGGKNACKHPLPVNGDELALFVTEGPRKQHHPVQRVLRPRGARRQEVRHGPRRHHRPCLWRTCAGCPRMHRFSIWSARPSTRPFLSLSAASEPAPRRRFRHAGVGSTSSPPRLAILEAVRHSMMLGLFFPLVRFSFSMLGERKSRFFLTTEKAQTQSASLPDVYPLFFLPFSPRCGQRAACSFFFLFFPIFFLIFSPPSGGRGGRDGVAAECGDHRRRVCTTDREKKSGQNEKRKQKREKRQKTATPGPAKGRKQKEKAHRSRAPLSFTCGRAPHPFSFNPGPRRPTDRPTDRQTMATASINDLLPTDVMHVILMRHVDPEWRPVAARVCSTWRGLVAAGSGDPMERLRVGKSLVQYAAGGGHIEAIAWLEMLGCPVSADACEAAACAGDVDTLRWLVAHRWPMEPSACAAAATHGHFDALRWLRAPDVDGVGPCALDSTALTGAMMCTSSDEAVLDWLVAEGVSGRTIQACPCLWLAVGRRGAR